MAIGGINIGQEILNVPMGEMIRSMAMSIADAQWSLDKSSIRVAEMMSGQAVLRDLHTGKPLKNQSGNLIYDDTRVSFGYVYTAPATNAAPKRESIMVSMMELGFTPNFYQFVDTIIEVKIAVTVTGSTENESANKSTGTTNSSGSSYDFGYGRNWWGNGRMWGAQSAQSRTVQTTQVNGSYSSKYGYSAEGASLLRTKLVPIPPPAILEDRIRNVMDMERSYEQWKLLDSRHQALTDEISKMTGNTEADKVAKAAKEAELDRTTKQIEDLIQKFGWASA
jgi:hypothetical protein